MVNTRLGGARGVSSDDLAVAGRVAATLRGVLRKIAAGRADVVGLLLLLGAAATALWWPQFGDQALFGEGGRVLAAGGVYWRDFWDVKQPGVFWLYALAETVGAGVLGVRLVEVAAVLIAGFVVLRVVGRWGLHPAVRGAAALLVLGPYVLSGDANAVGQVEGLVTLPMLVQYYALQRAVAASERPASLRWGAVAGLAAGVVGVLKLLYLPLGIVLLAGAAVERGSASSRREVTAWTARVGAAWVLAACMPPAAVVAYAAAHGVLPLAYYSTFVAPGEQLATGLFTVPALVEMVRALALATAVTGPLALVAVWTARRSRGLRRVLGLLAWLLATGVLVAPQLPTAYRGLVLLPPIGLLAVLGLDRLVTWAACRRVRGRPGAIVVAVLAVGLAPLAPGVVRLVAAGSAQGWSLADPVRLAVGDRIGGSFMVAPAMTMRGTVQPGTAVYVLGDPVVYRVLGTRQAIEMNGWGPEVMSPRMWDETVRELDRSRPQWVFVQSDYQGNVDRVPALVALLRSAYIEVPSRSAGGRWWRTDEPGTPSPSPEGNLLATAY